MPLAAPLLCSGAEVTMVWLLGDWNSAKPAPLSAMRQATSHGAGCPGIRASASSPAAKHAMPTPPSAPSG